MVNDSFEVLQLFALKEDALVPECQRKGNGWSTVKPRPEAHMDLILFEVFLKSIDLIPQQQILQRHYLYYR